MLYGYHTVTAALIHLTDLAQTSGANTKHSDAKARQLLLKTNVSVSLPFAELLCQELLQHEDVGIVCGFCHQLYPSLL